MNTTGVEEYINYLHQMFRIRKFEEQLNQLFADAYLHGTIHLSIGQEAVAVGACAALQRDDYITSNHRGHGHFIAKGGDIRKILAETCGLKEGYCMGRGGTQHMADLGIGHIGSNGITGGQIPIATGAALAIRMRHEARVVLCFFGDGAANEGIFHESLNMAAVWRLPVVYVCENNLYAMSTPVNVAFGIDDIAVRGASYGMPSHVVDGMDVIEVKRVVTEAVEMARRARGPTLVECKTYRFVGHSKSDMRIYRTREEENMWKERDPIKLLVDKLHAEGIGENRIRQIEAHAANEVQEAVEFVKSSVRSRTAQ